MTDVEDRAISLTHWLNEICGVSEACGALVARSLCAPRGDLREPAYSFPSCDGDPYSYLDNLTPPLDPSVRR